MTKDDMIVTGYRGTFGDCYRFMQKYGYSQTVDWDAANKEAGEISNRYRNTRAAQFCVDMLSAIYGELQRSATDGRESDRKQNKIPQNGAKPDAREVSGNG